MNMVAKISSITNSVAKLRTKNYFASNEYYSCVKPKEK
jgi:hypothetical protein